MKLFITGGTGWFGRAIRDHLRDSGIETVILSRTRGGHGYLTGDVETFTLPAGFTHVLHMSLESRGTERLLKMCAETGVERFLFTSSGAVYGGQQDSHISEFRLPGAVTTYAIAKLRGEQDCLNHKWPFKVVVARCFAFVGPNMPPNHYAISSFIHAALTGDSITVTGNSIRSYLYESDLAEWLMTLLQTGEGVYNVGSENSIATPDLAELVRDIVNPRATITQTGRDGTLYVPSTARARSLGLRDTVSLTEAIHRTAQGLRL